MKLLIKLSIILASFVIGLILHPYFIEISANELSVAVKKMSVTEMSAMFADQLVFSLTTTLISVFSFVVVKRLKIKSIGNKFIPLIYSISGAIIFWQLRIVYLYMISSYHLDSTYDLNIIYLWQATWLTEFFLFGAIVGSLLYILIYRKSNKINYDLR